MIDITIKTTIEGISAINEALEGIFANPCRERDVMVVQSIGMDIYAKLAKPLAKAKKERNLFNPKKLHSIKLKYHEAFALEQILLIVIGQAPLDALIKTTLNKIKDTLNQKLA